MRLLGGHDWWRYGVDRLAALARERGIALAVLPGEDRDDRGSPTPRRLPPRRARRAAAAISAKAAATICARCCGGSPRHAGAALECAEPRPVPRIGGYLPGDRRSRSRPADRRAAAGHGRSCRSSSIARCCSPPTPRRSTRCARRSRRAAWRRRRCSSPASRTRTRPPSSRTRWRGLRRPLDRHHDGLRRRRRAGEPTPLDAAGVPVLQAVVATTSARPGATARAGSAPPTRHACRAAGTRRPRARGRDRVQGSAARRTTGFAFTALDQPARAGPHRRGRRSDRRAGALAGDAARRAADRGADAGLSRRAGPHRLCGRARRAGERASRCSTISPTPATRCATRRRTSQALLDALERRQR